MRKPAWPAVVAFLLAVASSSGASAQFFIDVTLISANPVTCTTTDVTATGSGVSSFNLPAPPDNEVLRLYVNQSLAQTQVTSVTPTSNSFTGPISLFIGLPSPTSLPYVLTVDFFPAFGGNAVGRGTRLTVTCPAGGPGTFEFTSLRASVAPVPASSPPGLAWLGALLAIAGAAALRRRRALPR